ncbi:hypothetical protein ACJMK2_031994 [Sinanodonta woodiana]|uniref:Uncharacterized protein n=1 Tax=Sinanodonta woodiana TaxID=1069815 RepID=A0ABD3X0E9_SINWO
MDINNIVFRPQCAVNKYTAKFTEQHRITDNSLSTETNRNHREPGNYKQSDVNKNTAEITENKKLRQGNVKKRPKSVRIRKLQKCAVTKNTVKINEKNGITENAPSPKTQPKSMRIWKLQTMLRQKKNTAKSMRIRELQTMRLQQKHTDN